MEEKSRPQSKLRIDDEPKQNNSGSDNVGSSSAADDLKEGKGFVEKRGTTRGIFSRFFTWKFSKFPDRPAVVSDRDSGEARQSVLIKDLKSDVLVLQRNQQEKPAMTIDEALYKLYKFWYTQPVPRFNENIVSNETIESPEWRRDFITRPYTLPEGLIWDTLNFNDYVVLKELYTFLKENYIEDGECMFRFDYQADFLKWALQSPGWKKELHCSVREAKSGKLVGFISAIPGKLKIYDQQQTAVLVNFLCVHKDLRGKRLATFLIRELTRKVKLTETFVAVYTAGVVLPKPVASCHYWLRALNPKKLIETRFNNLALNVTLQKTIKQYKLPDCPKTPGFRKLEPQDCAKVMPLLENFLLKFDLTPIFNEEQFLHWFTPRTDVINSFVVEAADGSITDFVSYYTLPFTVVYHPEHKTIKAAYSFYNVSTTIPWVDLMHDALVTAKNSGYDVFYALDLMENKEFFKPLKFRIGSGSLQYYLYNWRCPSISPRNIGLVLQ